MLKLCTVDLLILAVWVKSSVDQADIFSPVFLTGEGGRAAATEVC